MKTRLLVFILYINYSLSQTTENHLIKKSIKSHPKKFRTGLIYNNAGKYVKAPTPVLKKIKESHKAYTVFAKPYPEQRDDQSVNHQSVPNSPYFALDHPQLHERRSRVKKVLPDYTIRKKRSAHDAAEKQSKNPTQLKSKSENGIKRLKSSGKRNEKHERVKKISSPVKLTGRNQSQTKKLTAAKKQGEDLRTGRIRIVSKTKLSGKKKQKLLAPRNRQLKKKSPQSAVRQSKKLKSTNNKRLSKTAPTKKKLNTGHTKQRVQKLRNISKNQKKISQSQRNRIFKNKTVRQGRKDPNARRLIAGRDAMIEEYPYTISIQKDKEHWCSGAILNPRLIITTANCLWRSQSISRLRVRAGSRHTGHGGQVARIQEVMKHPGWKLRRAPDNDVALAVLDRDIKFSHGVHAVDLPNRVMLPAFDDAWVTSWGTDRRDGIFDRSSASLQVYRARLLERDKCNNVTKRFGVLVSENFICLAQAGRRAPCTRDTGAPAVSDGVLWGLASWGIRKLCGTERFPAMFSYLASHSNMDFIINATHLLMADERFYPFPDRYPLRKQPLTTSTAMTLPW